MQYDSAAVAIAAFSATLFVCSHTISRYIYNDNNNTTKVVTPTILGLLDRENGDQFMQTVLRIYLWGLGFGILFSLGLSTSHAETEDWHHFEKMANQTIKAVKRGHPKDVEQLIRLQEHLMEIGISACKNYARANPQDAQMFHLVVNNAENMKALSLNEMKQQWHAKRFLLSHGIAVDKLHQNSTTGSLVDSVVHPATAYIALREYRRTGDKALLQQVRLELSEAVIQLTYLQ